MLRIESILYIILWKIRLQYPYYLLQQWILDIKISLFFFAYKEYVLEQTYLFETGEIDCE